jgi:hypothetical protein
LAAKRVEHSNWPKAFNGAFRGVPFRSSLTDLKTDALTGRCHGINLCASHHFVNNKYCTATIIFKKNLLYLGRGFGPVL